MTEPRRLLIVLSDRPSDWVRKGEIVDRYFNPGDVFDHIDLLLTNDDRPDLDALQRMAGRASVVVHNLPAPRWLFIATFGWTPSLLRIWARRVARLSSEIRPGVIRCHGVRTDLLAAVRVKEVSGAPLVVSLHSNPDVDQLRGRRATTLPRRIAGRLARRLEVYGLQRADLVLPVYEPIVEYLQSIGVARYEVAYNVVGHRATPKRDWDLRDGVLRAMTVSRQERGEKDPSPLLEAVAAVDGVHLIVVGDGPLHEELRELARRLGINERVTFHQSLPNDRVLRLMAESDLFVYSSEVFEISKACIEAALTGLPIVANDRTGRPAPELIGGHVRLVDGSTQSYAVAIEELKEDEVARARLGRAALDHARRHWAPDRWESHVAAMYEKLLGN